MKNNNNETIKNALIEYFKDQCDMSDWNGVYGYEIVKWLEHQDDKIPTVSANFIAAEKEKREYLSGKFLKCRCDFLDFKEGQTYWLEYIGDDEYNVRSDNLLGKTYHITPGKLYTIFKPLTWIEKEDEKMLQKKITTFYDYLNIHEQIFLNEKDEESKDFIARIKSMFKYIFNIK